MLSSWPYRPLALMTSIYSLTSIKANSIYATNSPQASQRANSLIAGIRNGAFLLAHSTHANSNGATHRLLAMVLLIALAISTAYRAIFHNVYYHSCTIEQYQWVSYYDFPLSLTYAMLCVIISIQSGYDFTLLD